MDNKVVGPFAKAWAAAAAVVLLWLLNGVTTGDWSQADALHPALTTVVMGGVVWLVPNRDQ